LNNVRHLYQKIEIMKKIIMLIIAAAFLAACHHQSIPLTGNITGASLENTHWKLIALNAMKDGLPVLQREVFVQLKEGRATGNAGCNSYFGSYTTTGTNIHFTGIGSTKMFCQQGMEVENNLIQALGDADNYRITGSQLELLKGNGMLARFEALTAD
jgi:heat shock protein HslJ